MFSIMRALRPSPACEPFALLARCELGLACVTESSSGQVRAHYPARAPGVPCAVRLAAHARNRIGKWSPSGLAPHASPQRSSRGASGGSRAEPHRKVVTFRPSSKPEPLAFLTRRSQAALLRAMLERRGRMGLAFLGSSAEGAGTNRKGNSWRKAARKGFDHSFGLRGFIGKRKGASFLIYRSLG